MKKQLAILALGALMSIGLASAVDVENEWHRTGSFCLPASSYNGWNVCFDYKEKYQIFWDNAGNYHYHVTDILHGTLYDPEGNERDKETYMLKRNMLLQEDYFSGEVGAVENFLTSYDYNDLIDYEKGLLKKDINLYVKGRQ